MKQWQHMLLGVLIGAGLTAIIFLVAAGPRGEPVVLQPPPTPPPWLVHIDGAVVRPGIYALPPGSRVQDAVQSAGGLTAAAAPTALNLAAKVKDGEKVIVPAFGDTRPAPIPAVSGALEAEPNGADPNGKVNLNTAGETALCDLPGIGPTRARAIIAYREEHGDFQVIDELLEVNGIGPATFEQLKDRVTLE